jgi:hypothetical protein
MRGEVGEESGLCAGEGGIDSVGDAGERYGVKGGSKDVGRDILLDLTNVKASGATAR